MGGDQGENKGVYQRRGYAMLKGGGVPSTKKTTTMTTFATKLVSRLLNSTPGKRSSHEEPEVIPGFSRPYLWPRTPRPVIWEKGSAYNPTHETTIFSGNDQCMSFMKLVPPFQIDFQDKQLNL